MTDLVDKVSEAIRSATAREEDGEFQSLGDMLASVGENRTRIICDAAARAAIRVCKAEMKSPDTLE